MRQYKVNPRGATNPIDVVDDEGKTVKVSVLQFKTKRIADAVAEELNRAFNTGQDEGERAVADMLLSRFAEGAEGDWQAGWRAAAKEARTWRSGGIDSQENDMLP